MPIGLVALSVIFVIIAWVTYPRRGDVTPAPAGYVVISTGHCSANATAPSCVIGSPRATGYVSGHLAAVSYFVTRPHPGLIRVHVFIETDLELQIADNGSTNQAALAQLMIPPSSGGS